LPLILRKECDLGGNNFAIDPVEKIAMKVFKILSFAILQFSKFRFCEFGFLQLAAIGPLMPRG
jgi:hypothetical protein